MIRFIPLILIAFNVFAQGPESLPCTPIFGLEPLDELIPTPRGRVRRSSGEDSERKRPCLESPCPPPLLSPVAPPPAPVLPLTAASTFVAPAPLPMDEDDYPDDEGSDSDGSDAQSDGFEFDPRDPFHVVSYVLLMWTGGQDSEYFDAISETINRIIRNPDQEPQEIIEEMNNHVDGFARIVNHCVDLLRFLVENPDQIDEVWNGGEISLRILLRTYVDENEPNNRTAAAAA